MVENKMKISCDFTILIYAIFYSSYFIIFRYLKKKKIGSQRNLLQITIGDMYLSHILKEAPNAISLIKLSAL